MISEALDKAIRFAARAHKDQVRKGSGVPYISHPFAVGMILIQHQFPETWVIAGILHDTIEDTEVTLDDIRREFGDEVADIVEGCSEPEHHTQSWEKRKQHTVDYIQNAPLAVKVVTCADKIHNLQSILMDRKILGDQIWQRFKRDRKKQEWYYRQVASGLVKHLKPQEKHPIFDELVQLVDRVFNEQNI